MIKELIFIKVGGKDMKIDSKIQIKNRKNKPISNISSFSNILISFH